MILAPRSGGAKVGAGETAKQHWQDLDRAVLPAASWTIAIQEWLRTGSLVVAASILSVPIAGRRTATDCCRALIIPLPLAHNVIMDWAFSTDSLTFSRKSNMFNIQLVPCLITAKFPGPVDAPMSAVRPSGGIFGLAVLLPATGKAGSKHGEKNPIFAP